METLESKPDGSKENPFEPILDSFPEERAYKYCRCGICQTVQQCTPQNDFYVRLNRDDLTCEKCFQRNVLGINNTSKIKHALEN
ncbi:hypothetical protein AUJ78_00305 [Candidatus Peregrinibacteria bacterium CG1_02_41_10]|nr:MAG: hypothetical protein AUJ78_00305 [Candidatus Peregrinibacteria bacterium CG1_02_41_10]